MKEVSPPEAEVSFHLYNVDKWNKRESSCTVSGENDSEMKKYDDGL